MLLILYFDIECFRGESLNENSLLGDTSFIKVFVIVSAPTISNNQSERNPLYPVWPRCVFLLTYIIIFLLLIMVNNVILRLGYSPTYRADRQGLSMKRALKIILHPKVFVAKVIYIYSNFCINSSVSPLLYHSKKDRLVEAVKFYTSSDLGESLILSILINSF